MNRIVRPRRLMLQRPDRAGRAGSGMQDLRTPSCRLTLFGPLAMCGLFLVLERGRPVDGSRARQALRELRHRGPDGIGHHDFVLQSGTPDGPRTVSGYLGHTRLSILDPSDRSNQPFLRGAQALAYNGEIYNFRDLRADLARQGNRFETSGDTEVLLALLGSGGVAALARANGQWAFTWLDQDTGQVLAARDRYGKKPLFYYADADTVCFSSEIAPIFSYLGRRPAFVAGELERFLCHGWLFPEADGRTHLHGIRQVRAGAALRFDAATWRLQEQACFAWPASDSDAAPEQVPLADLVQDAVLTRLVADRRVGLLLSGGVDSSLVLSVLHARGMVEGVTCFTGDAGKSEDARYAQACIAQLGLRAVTLPLDYSATSMAGFLDVCRRQEKPFPFIGNVLAMPQMYAHIAQHDVPVVLDGTGGDEIFAGYWDRYYRFAMAEAVAAGDQRWIDDSLQANTDDPVLHRITQLAVRQARPGASAASGADGMLCSPQDPADMSTFATPAVRAAPAVDPLVHFRGTLVQALAADAGRGRLQEWLWQNDRNAMACGIENRSPLLDFRLAPYMRTGYARKFVGAWNKHELRNLFSAFTPLPTQWRRDKQGFRWVYSRFLRANRAQVLELVAASQLLPPHVDVPRLIDAARRDERYLECGLLQRMLCVAGLEQAMGLAQTSCAPPPNARPRAGDWESPGQPGVLA